MTRLRIGTRGSALALWQANWVAAELRSRGHEVELCEIKTEGDVVQSPLAQAGGQGLFTKAIQAAILRGDVDCAVHSLKDLPTDETPGLTLAAVPRRADWADALVLPSNLSEADRADVRQRGFAALPQAARIGTGSVRRQAQLLSLRSDLQVSDIRGNVDTRLRKLDEGQFDAIVLACAGLSRLEFTERLSYRIPAEEMLPAVGQGALGIEAAGDNLAVCEAVAELNDSSARACVTAERALLARLRGGCLAPIGALASVAEDVTRPADSQDDESPVDALKLEAVILDPRGTSKLIGVETGSCTDAQWLGESLADRLLSEGAERLLQAARD